MRNFTRRELLLGGVALGAGLVYPARPLAAPDRPQLENQVIPVPGLDLAHDGLRVVQLSDLHAGRRTHDALILAAVAQANALEPDLVLLTGDFVCRDRREVGLARELLAGLRPPTYAVLGNHDIWTDRNGTAAALAALGYELLDNAWTRIPLHGAPLVLVGVGDAVTRQEDVPRAVAGLPAEPTPLVMAHCPTTANRLRHLGRPLLCLSGHTHGGQISVPILTPMMMASLSGDPYVRGRYRVGDVDLYVNRGIGNSGVKVRINSPPEVTLFTLRAA